MSTREEIWSAQLHAAVDEHPSAVAFDVESYVAASRKRVRRNRAAAVVATVATIAVVAAVAAVATDGLRGEAPEPAHPVVRTIPIREPGTNGWVAVDARAGDIYLVRPGEDARRLDVAGSDTANEACPAWSPDGTWLMLGRLTGSSTTTVGDAALVIVAVDTAGAAAVPRIIPLDGFKTLEGFEPHPCGTWAPDGRWVALRGPGEVWLVDTQTGAVRRLPDLRPIDLEWRPGTDQLAIAGDMGITRAAGWRSTQVSTYSVSTGDLRDLGSVHASDITWSPDGTTLAYTGGGPSAPGLRLVDASGENDRVLVADPGTSLHGIGPVWSPKGDRIVYQRACCPSAEGSEVVVVAVPDGTQTVIKPPKVDDPPAGGLPEWYPYLVTWSPDGTTLLYVAWANSEGILTVPVEAPGEVTVLPFTLGTVPGYKDHRWSATQMWGRLPE